MSLTFRSGRSRDLDAIARLSDRVFRSSGNSHMADEFPLLYGADRAARWVMADELGTVVGIAGALVWPAVLEGFPTWVASVGSVATAPEYRGQRVATRLLQLLEDHLRDEGVRLMLISGDRSLYYRFGARPVGHVNWYHLLRPTFRRGRYRVSPLEPDTDAVNVARLYAGHATRFIRSASQLKALLQTQPLTAVEHGTPVALMVQANGEPVSYAIINHRPFDGRKPSRVSEWGGSVDGLLAAVTTVDDWPAGGLLIPARSEDWSLKTALDGMPFTSRTFSWLAKIIDGEGLYNDLARLWSERAAISAQVVLTAPDRYRVTRGPNHWDVDAATLTEWVFGDAQPGALQDLWPIAPLWPEGLNYV